MPGEEGEAVAPEGGPASAPSGGTGARRRVSSDGREGGPVPPPSFSLDPHLPKKVPRKIQSDCVCAAKANDRGIFRGTFYRCPKRGRGWVGQGCMRRGGKRWGVGSQRKSESPSWLEKDRPAKARRRLDLGQQTGKPGEEGGKEAPRGKGEDQTSEEKEGPASQRESFERACTLWKGLIFPLRAKAPTLALALSVSISEQGGSSGQSRFLEMTNWRGWHM